MTAAILFTFMLAARTPTLSVPPTASPAGPVPAPASQLAPPTQAAPSAPQAVRPVEVAPMPPKPDISGPSRLERALAGLPTLPTIETVQQAARARLGIDPRTVNGWLRRARAAAALPTLTAAYDQGWNQGVTLAQEPGTANELNQDATRTRGMSLRSVWELDRLVFNVDELRAARASLDLVELRERVLTQVTQLYFERLRVLVDLRLATDGTQSVEPSKAAALYLRQRELEAILEGLSGISFATSAPAVGLPTVTNPSVDGRPPLGSPPVASSPTGPTQARATETGRPSVPGARP